jgi:hypothetical protein
MTGVLRKTIRLNNPSKGIKSILVNHMLDLIEEAQSDITS